MRTGGTKTSTRALQPRPDTLAEQAPTLWAQDAVRLLDLAAQLMSKTLSQRLLAEMPEARQVEMTLPQLQALRYLWLHSTVFMGELAEGLDISYPSATNMVKRLAEKDLVCRVVNPRDRREVEVVLTETGRALIQRLETERIIRVTRLLEQVNDADRASLLHGLRQFIAHVVADDSGAAREICLRCGWRASSTCPIAEIIPLFPCN